ncbi:MAG: inositol monophosphatase family protein [Acidimicrobiales bacterium]
MTAPDPADLLRLATELARAAGRLTLDMRASARLTPDSKSSVSDLVTAADRAAESLIVDGILANRPDDAVLGEEGADIEGTSGVRWIIDPIDGTSNYVYDLPGYTISIAAEADGVVVAGVVFDPKADELFAASLGGGATMNGNELRCSERTELDQCVIATGFGYGADQRLLQAKVLVHVLPALGNIRRLGSAALDLAYVGAGRTDGYWETGLNAWDAAAGALIAAEAGAVVTDLHGGSPSKAMTLATPPTIHARLQHLLQSAYDAELGNLAV